MSKIFERVASLRAIMQKAGISACIIPGTDPHASEYIADYWKERVWISGFTGSAGTAVVTTKAAGLWTDSRYFLQAQEQLLDSGFDLMKMGLSETPDIVEWLTIVLKKGDRVGVNAQMFSVNAYASMKSQLQTFEIELVSIDLPKQVWMDRPALPKDPFFVFDEKFAGVSASSKLTQLRTQLSKMNADTFVISALDDIAWLFNIRGKDVDYNPVVIAFALIEENKATLFVDPDKLTNETSAYLKSQNVELAEYHDIYKVLGALSSENTIIVDAAKLNQSIFEAIPSSCVVKNQMSPVFKLKSIKNEVEMSGYRKAMIKDAVALTHFFKWLEENVNTGMLTEVSVDKKLYEFRSQQEYFMGESFGSIAGYGPHGAIVHYSAMPETASTLKSEGIFLLDSGGQYLDGTTDITRTIALGTPTLQQKKDFTLVLKGHINLSKAIFPVGTRGSQIDVLARKAMWDLGLNYGHGTGHGVGHFLNVHEGPQSIRMDENPVVLQVGMFMSNEPGLYRTNQYGIRIENLIHIVPAFETEFGKFLKFETITLFPIDQVLIDVEMLTDVELDWVNTYHNHVYETVSPKLAENDREWLSRKCSMLKR